MTAIASYPHYRINVEDRSIFVPIASDELPLHRPIYAMHTQRGPVGVPVWCPSITEARKIFGEETFNPLNEKYFSPSSFYLNETFQNNGNFIVRLLGDCAEAAMLILEVSVKTTQVQQYVTDPIYGTRDRDEFGDWIPDTLAGEQPGIDLNWKTRTSLRCDLDSGAVIEDLENLLPYNEVDDEADSVTTYPIAVFTSVSGGIWGNNVGFKLSWGIGPNANGAAERAGAIFYTLAPVEKEYDASSVDPLRTNFGDVSIDFVLKPNVIDESLPQAVSFKEVVEAQYSGNNALPYSVNVYSDNINAVGLAIAAVEVNRVDELSSADPITSVVGPDGWLANIVSLQDLAGLPYDHVVKHATSEVSLNDSSINYLKDGTDGDDLNPDGTLPDDVLEALVRDFYELDINPDIVDRARYPYTHIFDIGWSTETKFVIIDFLSIRDDIKVVMSTQRVTLGESNGYTISVNDASTDAAVGSALRSAALVNRESIIKGTGAFRAMIMQQAGIPVGNLYGKWLPTTLWYASKLALYHNRNFLSQEPAGLPNSDVDLFKEFNWVPAAESARETSWNNGLNYLQYYSMTRLHFPALRSVYRFDTSVLAIDDFTNALVYTKHEIRRSWAKFAGVTRPAGILQDQIEKDLSARLERLYNDRYQFTVTVYQTDEEKKLGYVHHVRVDVTSPGQNRVWDVDLIVHRENFEG
jgi:hypothetical protein